MPCQSTRVEKKKLAEIRSEIDKVLAEDRALQRRVMSGEITKAEFDRLATPVHMEWDRLRILEAECKTHIEKIG